ncbi:MAG: HU family DNA-binding protein [Oscillospiraceae bacterium]|nr:HU family DNA-binding protein [Oscillospiraceae bacterium]
MTKIELVAAIAEKTGFSKKNSEVALIAVIDSITDALKKGEKVSLVGFGTFEVRERAAREGINPQTQKKIKIAAKKVPAFKAGKLLKESVAKAKVKK